MRGNFIVWVLEITQALFDSQSDTICLRYTTKTHPLVSLYWPSFDESTSLSCRSDKLRRHLDYHVDRSQREDQNSSFSLKNTQHDLRHRNTSTYPIHYLTWPGHSPDKCGCSLFRLSLFESRELIVCALAALLFVT